MIIIPALIYTFETLRREGTSEYEYRRWYKSIERALRKNEMELNNDLLESIPSFEIAQKLLDLPIDNALEALVSHDTPDYED